MSDNRPSIQRIIDAWSDRYGNRFLTAVRKSAIGELILDLVAYEYSREEIERAKPRVMKEMVGPRSPYGAAALKDWKIKAATDFDKAVRAAFEHVEERTGPVEVPFTPAVLTDEERLEIEKQEASELKELNESLVREPEIETSDIHEDEEQTYSHSKLVISPEMDRSRFADVETTPIMSDEEYFALLERENNER